MSDVEGIQAEDGGNRLDPAALTLADAARVLSAAAGRRVTVEQLQADVDAGAPVSPDGRINLVHYAAWLVREVEGDAKD